MHDEVSTGSKSYNPVTHIKELWECPLSDVSEKSKGTYTDQLTTVTEATIGAAPAVSFGIDSWPYMASTDTLKTQALNSVDPGRIRPDRFNLPVFLGELRDIKDLAESIAKSILRTIKYISTQSKLQLSTTTTLGQLMANAVDADLMYKFGVRPLLSDYRALMSLDSRIAAVIDRLNRETPVRVYGKASASGSGGFTAVGYPNDYYYWGNSIAFTREVVVWGMVTQRAVNIPSIKDGMLLAVTGDLVNATGFKQAAWELIPFSFVVDYFIDIGNYLAQYDGSIVEIEYSVIQAGYSIKESAISTGWVDLDAGAYRSYKRLVSPPEKVYGTLTKSRYTRIPDNSLVFGAGINPPALSLPDFRQVWTIFELLSLFFRGESQRS
jgi:hypothetical protein